MVLTKCPDEDFSFWYLPYFFEKAPTLYEGTFPEQAPIPWDIISYIPSSPVK